MWQIVTKDKHGNVEPLQNADDYESEIAAWDGVRALRALGNDWAEANYGVRYRYPNRLGEPSSNEEMLCDSEQKRLEREQP